jgi:hypothetical protein
MKPESSKNKIKTTNLLQKNVVNCHQTKATKSEKEGKVRILIT